MMWKKLAFTAVKIGLGLLAPRTGGAVNDILKVADIALPIVERVSSSTANESKKWDTAVELAQSVIGNKAQDNIVESGVQLAYSIFKSKTGQK